MNHLRSLCAALFCLSACVLNASGQDQKQGQSGDVLRISTELVQTAVTVLDKQGQFVEGLKPEQFELRVDGKPMPISFFERVSAGSLKEVQLAPQAGAAGSANAPAQNLTAAADYGRIIVFFIDDLHLSAEGMVRTRKALTNFVDKEMGLSDRVAIASASGQIGFLQQLTDNKAVLHAAIKRLVHKPYSVRDVETIGMTEYQALRIEQGDRDALYYFVSLLEEQTKVKIRGGASGPTREQSAKMIKERAKFMLKVSADVTLATLGSLSNWVRSIAETPGRKLVFFFSDGFFLDDRNSDARDRLRSIIDTATRTNAVVYTLDTRGLILPDGPDASNNRRDPIGQLARANVGELSASQAPLSALAEDTGGRARLNTFALTPAVDQALKETSNYYLLAWRPETEEQKSPKFKRVEAVVVGRPELTIRLPRGYFVSAAMSPSPETIKASSKETGEQPGGAKAVDAALRTAIGASSVKNELPTLLAVSYLDTPNNGTVLTASMQMATGHPSAGAEAKQATSVDLAGVILNDQGKTAATFRTRLKVGPADQRLFYNYRSPLKPGIYQVRVAARDEKSGRMGSATRWIEIPDLASKQLTLSSLLLGGQMVRTGGQGKDEAPQMQFSVDNRFSRSSQLSFLMFIYNASRGSGPLPDVSAQAQVYRDGQAGGQAVLSGPVQKLSAEAMSDPARILYGGELKLASLSPGKYILQVNVTDKSNNAAGSQRILFEVE